MTTGRFAEETVEVAQTRVYGLEGGTGRPLLVLHGVNGHECGLAFHEALAAQATVYAPAPPGCGQTPRPEWMETIAHLMDHPVSIDEIAYTHNRGSGRIEIRRSA